MESPVRTPILRAIVTPEANRPMRQSDVCRYIAEKFPEHLIGKIIK